MFHNWMFLEKYIDAIAKWLTRQTADAEVQSSSPIHGMKELKDAVRFVN